MRGDSTPQGSSILLASFFEEVYRPLEQRHRPATYKKGARRAIRLLANYLRRRPVVADLNRETIDAFARSLSEAGVSQKGLHFIRTWLNGLWRYASALGLHSPFVDPRLGRKLAEPHGEPGTIAHFFQTVFKPQTLQRCNVQHEGNYLTTLRKLRVCFGRDLRLSELSAANLAEFVAWLNARGLSAQTVKNIRANLLTIWQYAHDEQLAPEVCRVRRIKAPREQPDAWSLRDVERIIEAAGQLDKPPIGDIPANEFWPAMLLIGWYTGLRRRALFAIETQNVDLRERWIYLPAAAMKNSVGKRFRIGEDAIAAIRRIYNPSRHLLFPSPRNGSRRSHDMHFAEILRRAQIPPSRLDNGHFHKLRRTTATHVAAAAGLAAASALLGHSGPELLKRYIDPTYIVGNDATEFLPALRATDAQEGGNRG